jgi:hypothetical protein
MRHVQSIRLVLLGAVVAFFALAPEGASASSIGVYFAPDASDCDATVGSFMPLNWYVIAVCMAAIRRQWDLRRGPSCHRRPTSWFHIVSRNPESPNPPGDLPSGVEVEFTCMGTSGPVLFSPSSLSPPRR